VTAMEQSDQSFIEENPMKSQLTSLVFGLRLKTSNLFESVNKQLPYSFVHLLALVIELILFVRASHHRNKKYASPHVTWAMCPHDTSK